METIEKTLTDRFLFNHKNPQGVNQVVFKHKEKLEKVTLYCRSNQKTKTFYIRKEVPDEPRTIWTLGAFPKLKVAEAENAAETLAKDLAGGNVPIEEVEDAIKIRTVDEALNVYLASRKHILAPRTASDYKADIKRLGWGKLPIRKISEAMVRAKVDEYVGTGTVKTGNDALKTLQRLYLYFNKKGVLTMNPVGYLSVDKLWPPTAPNRPVFKTEEDWATAMIIAREWTTPEVGDFFMFVGFTGLRPWQECATLKWSEVDFDARTITILNEHLKVKGPGRVEKGRTLNLVIPMTDPLEAILKRRWHHDRPSYSKAQQAQVFPSKMGNSATGHLSTTSVDGLIKAIRDELKYPEIDEIVTYSLRRFYIKSQRRTTMAYEVRYYLTDQDPVKLRGQQAIYDPLDMEIDIRPEAEKLASYLAGLQ